MQLVLVYLNWFRCSSLLKCVSQPEIAKNPQKTVFWRSRLSKVIDFNAKLRFQSFSEKNESAVQCSKPISRNVAAKFGPIVFVSVSLVYTPLAYMSSKSSTDQRHTFAQQSPKQMSKIWYKNICAFLRYPYFHVGHFFGLVHPVCVQDFAHRWPVV